MIPRDAFFRTRTGLWFAPMLDVKAGLQILVVHQRRGARPFRFTLNCCDGIAGFMIRGPKEWTPGGDPEGFERSVEIRKLDGLYLYFDGKMVFQSFDQQGCFGILRFPSPLYEALLTVRT